MGSEPLPRAAREPRPAPSSDPTPGPSSRPSGGRREGPAGGPAAGPARPLPEPGRPLPWPARPLSEEVREGCRDAHRTAEGTAFVRDLLGGRVGPVAYGRYAEQLWYVYRALEDGARALAADPVAGPFLQPGLPRVPALERDLGHLLGPGWRERSAPLPETVRYVRRVRSVAASWPAGYVAHHYTRYLGDLSGGRVLRAAAERAWGLPPGGDGVRFYVFDAVPDPAAFKREYRARMDALPLAAGERRAFVAECRAAFALNTALLRALG
jgi:heme oxygenase (biliverdin-producing, ferredoxin)